MRPMLRHAAALVLFFVAVACGTAGASPAGADVVARIELGPAPCSVARTPGAAWATIFNGDEVARIDTDTNEVVARIATSPKPCGIVEAAGAVWGDELPRPQRSADRPRDE